MPGNVGILGQSAPGATTLTTLYTVPLGFKTEVTVIIANRSTATAFRIAAAADGAVDGNEQYVAYDKLIEANDCGVTTPILLGPGDKIRVWAGSAKLSFTCTGLEEYHQ